VSAALFLDTNVLLYSVGTDPAEADKRQISLELLERNDIAISVQVLSEFYVQSTRASRKDALPHTMATELIRCWMRFPVQDNTTAVFGHALQIKTTTGFSFWDSAIIAAACAQGCRDVISEDLSHGRQIEGVRIVNPFR
jgi:predicted nucleic acid-binding protein